MRFAASRLLAMAALFALPFATGACTRVVGHQGFIADSGLIDNVQPGIDNRASVERTLGRPSFVGQFDNSDWYYFARQTKQLAFANPTATDQTVLRVHFDAAGNVASVNKAGMAQIARLSPAGDKTKTLGRDRSFFQELFGNIGQVGSVGKGGGTADNPE